MKVFCATGNPGKLAEFQVAARQFGFPEIEIEMLPRMETIAPVEETGDSFEENAILKARYYGAFASGFLFADDSGLEVDSLGGEPGVRSARYAGEDATDAANNRLLLFNLEGAADRRGRFVCVIALVEGGELLGTFRGEVEGEILLEERGDGGFGYDPLFWYPPFASSFGEIDRQRKMQVSHRGKALQALFTYLQGRDSD
jgi:XTP/dITP diphosphohydrolase